MIDSFKSDADFALPSDRRTLGSPRPLQSKLRSTANVTLLDDQSDRKIAKTSRRSHNDRFSKLYSSSIDELGVPNGDRSKTPDFRSDDHNLDLENIEEARSADQNVSRASIKVNNRVVVSTHSSPLFYDRPLRPLSSSLRNNQNDTRVEFKDWPSDPIADEVDLLNYERYTENIAGAAQQSSTFGYGDAPIYVTKMKKPSDQSVESVTDNLENYHTDYANHGDVIPTIVSTESLGTSSSYDREPFTQPNVQKIIQWLQIPPLAPGQNQTHLGDDIVRDEAIGNGFDQSYPVDPDRPIAQSSGTYYGLESRYPTESLESSQSSSHYRPLGTYYDLHSHHSIATQSPYQNSNDRPTSQKPYEPLTHPYQQLHNYNKHPDILYLPTDKPNRPANSPGSSYLPAVSDRPYQPSVRPSETITLPTSVVTLLTDLASKQASHSQRPSVFRPVSQISQNTVVHILNPGSKKPNVTVSEMKVPQVEKPAGSSVTNHSGSGVPPNLHIMFMNEEMQNPEKPSSDRSTESPFSDKNCPTIMINSITRVNNTIQSKDGCTDLNIVINSQVLSTNVFKPGGSAEDGGLQDKYVDGVSSESPSENPYDNYSPVYTQDPHAGSTAGSWQVNGDPDRNDLPDSQAAQNDDGSFFATSEIFQTSEVSVSTGDPQEGAFDAVGSEISDAPEVGSAIDDPVASVVGNAPEVAQAAAGESLSPVGQAIGGSVADPAPIGQLPVIPPAVAGAGGAGSVTPGSTALAAANDDDDDDDDFFDLSPSGIMESMGSVFTYFTFLNPLNYGLFSMAAAPFAAMAAGVVGIAAVLFPWTLPGVLDFGRSADKVTIKFTPSLDEVFKHSIHNYRNWHEWKSKRKKRKR